MPTPMAGTQAPGFFRLKVGSYEVTVLSDGGLALDAALFAGDQAGKEKCLKDAHLPTTGIPTPVNTWLVNTGSKLVLVDTGGGKNFAPTLGRLPQNLAAAGVSPDAVDIIVRRWNRSNAGWNPLAPFNAPSGQDNWAELMMGIAFGPLTNRINSRSVRRANSSSNTQSYLF